MPFMANLADQTFVDDLGRRVYLSKPPHRIVSLAPSVTEILFAVGLDAEVVGVTTFCDYPAQAKTRPKIGAAIPNLRSEEHTSELQSRLHLVCRLLLEKKKKTTRH